MPSDIVSKINKEYLIGVDEVGYGALAGPMYVCAFMAPRDWSLKGLTDSKKLSANKRTDITLQLMQIPNVVEHALVSAHPNNSKQYAAYGDNMHSLLKYLYWKAVSEVLDRAKERKFHKAKSYHIILDGIIKFPEIPYKLGDAISLPKADLLIQQVSAASVIAKHFRDEHMKFLSSYHPEYNWHKNAGYPTPDHLEALKKYSYCDEHRRAYEPIKSMVKL